MNKVLKNTQTTMCRSFSLRTLKHFNQAPTAGADIPTFQRGEADRFCLQPGHGDGRYGWSRQSVHDLPILPAPSTILTAMRSPADINPLTS